MSLDWCNKPGCKTRPVRPQFHYQRRQLKLRKLKSGLKSEYEKRPVYLSDLIFICTIKIIFTSTTRLEHRIG